MLSKNRGNCTYEMLLGGNWLKVVGPIFLDIGSLALTMVKDGQRWEEGGVSRVEGQK
jgi:hypothetical protein